MTEDTKIYISAQQLMEDSLEVGRQVLLVFGVVARQLVLPFKNYWIFMV